MDIQSYLQRINYRGKTAPTLQCLQEIHRAHALSIPFENLDIHYGNTITLDIDRIFHKVVLQGRGGFCYELNGLFHYLLRELGFEVKMIAARVYNPITFELGPEFDHMANIVTIMGEEYLADVGFGSFYTLPIPLKPGLFYEDSYGNYTLESLNENKFLYKFKEMQDWVKRYIFTTTPRKFADFSEMCNYHQINPNSFFTQRKFITLPTLDGRITIVGNSYKQSFRGRLIKEKELSKKEYRKILLKCFGIKEEEI